MEQLWFSKLMHIYVAGIQSIEIYRQLIAKKFLNYT